MSFSYRLAMLAYTRLLIAGAAAYSMSTLFSAMKPVLLTRFVEQVGFSEPLAGLTVAMPFVGIASAAPFVHLLVRRLSLKALVSVFGSLFVLAELVSAYGFQIRPLILAVQFLGGFSVGVLMGATSRVIATTRAPDQIFGFVDMIAVLLMSFMIFGVGWCVEQEGLRGGYLFAFAVALLFVLLMFAYRSLEPELRSSHGSQTAEEPVPPLTLSLRPLAVVVMGVLFVTSSGLGFAFMFTIARDLGMSYDAAGSSIGILLFLSAFACQLGGWASARFGPLRPLAGAFLTCSVGWYLVIHATNSAMFLLALVPAVFSLQFNFPILLALSGSLDRHGQWAAIASPLLTSGFAWAAIAAGAIVGRWGIEALAVATGLGMAICLGLLLLARERSMKPSLPEAV